MKAIVIGANGFIGRWLVKELIDNNYDVTIVVRHNKDLNTKSLYNKCTIIEKDANELDVKDFDSPEKYDVFYNLAWEGVAPELKNDIELQLGNIQTSIKMIELCNKLGCGLFISTGTVAEYALTTDVMDLNSKQSPNDMYGAAKVSSHYFLNVRSRQLKQPFIWCVVPSTYGEGRKTNNILTYTINELLKEKKPLYGNLDQMWDFLYISDVARALRLIGEKGHSGKVYGIGSGEYRQLKDYIITIRNIINPDLPLGIGEIPEYSERTFSSCVNIYDLIKDTGFKPLVSFEDGIRKTINYYKTLIEFDWMLLDKWNSW